MVRSKGWQCIGSIAFTDSPLTWRSRSATARRQLDLLDSLGKALVMWPWQLRPALEAMDQLGDTRLKGVSLGYETRGVGQGLAARGAGGDAASGKGTRAQVACGSKRELLLLLEERNDISRRLSRWAERLTVPRPVVCCLCLVLACPRRPIGSSSSNSFIPPTLHAHSPPWREEESRPPCLSGPSPDHFTAAFRKGKPYLYAQP